jgi:CRP/FNR family transcriptional regulator
MTVTRDFLQSIPYFRQLDAAALESVQTLVFERSLVRGDSIVLEGEPVEALYFVGSGAVKLLRTSADGKEQILNIVRPGDSFNEVPVFDGGPSPASAQAMGPVTLYGIHQKDLGRLLQNQPQIASGVISVLAGQIRRLMSLVEDLSFRPVVARVARVLLEYAGGDGASPPKLTQQDMAAMAGTAREVVSRSLRSLEESGIISLDRHRIVVKNREALNNIAGVT